MVGQIFLSQRQGLDRGNSRPGMQFDHLVDERKSHFPPESKPPNISAFPDRYNRKTRWPGAFAASWQANAVIRIALRSLSLGRWSVLVRMKTATRLLAGGAQVGRACFRLGQRPSVGDD
jgi:hypothetical protein